MATASATGYLKLDINGFKEAISSAKRLLGGLAGAFVAFKTVGFFKKGIEDAINFGHEIHQASMRMGQMDPGNLLISQKVLERMGLSSEEARGELEKMVESGKPLATLFRSADDYAKAVAAAKGDYGSQANVLSKSAKEFNAVFYTIKSIGEKVKTLFLAATSGFLKPMKLMLDSLNKLDLAPKAEAFGKKVGEILTEVIGAFKSGQLWEYTKLNLTLAFLEAGRALSNLLKDISNNGGTWMSDAFNQAIEVLRKGLESVFSLDWFEMIFNKIAGFVTSIGYLISAAVGSRGAEREYADSSLGYYDKAAAAEKRMNEKGGLAKFIMDFGFADDANVSKNIQDTKDALQKMTEPWKLQMGKPMDLGPPEGMRGSLGAGSGPWSVIADSLASIGGGGGFIQSSLSPEAKEAMKANQQLKVIGDQQKETNEILKGMGSNSPTDKKLLMKK